VHGAPWHTGAFLMNWLETIRWDDKGLVPVIAQEQTTGDVLMFAWMNSEALQKTAELGRAVYFSRSRGQAVVQRRRIGSRADRT
jgi:phosphoribosyl-AMP cyclohydrolase